jgi:GNAT superfamily N-acetyltransferase
MIRTTDSVDVRIRRAATTDRGRVGAIVAAAFFDDPTTRWLLPDVRRRREVVLPMFELYVSLYLRHGETYRSEDGAGAAVWLTPGVQLCTADEDEAFGAKLLEMLGGDARRAFQMAEIFAEHHPEEPLYYSQFLATEPDHQGRGIGSAYLRDMLRRADSDGLPAYHEATCLRNRALYERHGYVARGEFTLPDGGPTLHPMWREPR